VILRFEGLKNRSQKQSLEQFCKKACRLVPALRGNGELSILFVTDRRIRQINKKFLNHDFATDVIAFPYSLKGLGGEADPFGDIYVSLDTAAREARKGGYSALQELALYCLHGMLHLAGYDDHGPKNREKMFAAQKSIFKRSAPRLAPPDHR